MKHTEDFIAELEPSSIVAYFLDDSSQLPAQGQRQSVVEPRPGLAFGDHPVQRVHATCFHSDQYLTSPRLGSRSPNNFDAGRIAIGMDPRGSHGRRRMWIRTFALLRGFGQLAEWRAPLAPSAPDDLWTLRFTFCFEPSAREPGLPQSSPDVWTSSHEIPQKTGPVVLDHHDDRALIQTVVQRTEPIAEGRIKAGAQTIFAAQGGMRTNQLSQRVNDKLRCKG